MSVSINEINELAFEKARLAYGKRRASRLFWVKTTMHELAEKLSDEEVGQLIQKMATYDKRWWPARAVIRLFTSISKQRELLMYRLVNNVVTALTQSDDPLETLREKQPMLNQIVQVGQRAPRFAWFRRTFATWQTWIANKLNLNQAPSSSIYSVDGPEPAEQPMILDTPQAISRFRDQVQKDVVTIAKSYFAARENLVLNNPTDEKRRDAFDECFSEFKKLLRKIQLKYHPDKIELTQKKHKEYGLTIETLKIEIEAAHKEINPIWQDFKERSDILREYMHKSVEQNERLARLAEKVKEFCDPNSEYNKRQAEILEAIDRRFIESLEKLSEEFKEKIKKYFNEQLKEESKDHIVKYSFEIKEIKDLLNAMDIRNKKTQQEQLTQLSSLDKKMRLAASALAEQGIIIPQPNPIVSTHPSALFAQKNAPSDNANVKENGNTEIEKQAPTPNM